jgi:triacylglycerol lipase
MFLFGCGQNTSTSNLNSQQYRTRYPIVFLNGAIPTNELAANGVIAFLRSRGYDAYTTFSDGATPLHHRANQLRSQIEKIREEHGYEKVNLLGYSMGGLDGRYLISILKYGEHVASLSTLGTPHHGTPVADLVLGNPLTDGGLDAKTIDKLKEIIKNFFGAAHDLSVQYVNGEFNKTALDDPNVFYQSVAASTSLGGLNKNNVNPLFILTYEYLKHKIGNNDGLVPTDSAKWGIATEVQADHFDLVGIPYGITSFPYLGILAQIGEELAKRGL